jgi:hypothetical protein
MEMDDAISDPPCLYQRVGYENDGMIGLEPHQAQQKRFREELPRPASQHIVRRLAALDLGQGAAEDLRLAAHLQSSPPTLRPREHSVGCVNAKEGTENAPEQCKK